MKMLAEALVKAQGEMRNASLNKINPHFKSRYADLAEIRDCTIPILARHGLTVMQLTDIKDGQVVLITRLLHQSGESVDSVYPLNGDPLKPQSLGSAMTYARRYCLAAMCGIAAEEDDDGNAAEKYPRKATSPDSKPKADSRVPYGKLAAEIVAFNSLDELDAWWGAKDTDAARSTLPADWRRMLFVEFIGHGLIIAESEAAESAFKQAYSKQLNLLSDEERQGIDDKVIEAKKQAA